MTLEVGGVKNGALKNSYTFCFLYDSYTMSAVFIADEVGYAFVKLSKNKVLAMFRNNSAYILELDNSFPFRTRALMDVKFEM